MPLYQTAKELLFNLEATSSSEANRKWKQSIKEHWNYECAYCGNKENLTLDHIIPRSRGGSNNISNVVCACKDCNESKGQQFWSSWYLNQYFFDIEKLTAIIEWQSRKTENGYMVYNARV